MLRLHMYQFLPFVCSNILVLEPDIKIGSFGLQLKKYQFLPLVLVYPRHSNFCICGLLLSSKILCRKSFVVAKVFKYDVRLLFVQKAVIGSRRILLEMMMMGRSFIASVALKLAGESVSTCICGKNPVVSKSILWKRKFW